MSTHIDIESLEALAADEAIANGALVASHLASCDECSEELAWLRSERALFSQRAEQVGDAEHLWDGVAEKIARANEQRAPYRENGLPLPAPRPPRATRWWLLAAALPLVLAGAGTFAVVRRAAQSKGALVAQRAVHGAVLLRVRTSSADVRIDRGADDRVSVLSADRGSSPTLVAIDERTVELRFERTPSGRVRVEVPRGTGLDVTTSSGDVTIGAIGGATKIITSSGDIEAAELGATDVTSTSGDVRVRSIIGSIAIRTSSGDIEVGRSTRASQTLLSSTSGSVQWAGHCATDCRLQARSNSGDVRLAFDRASSVTVRFETSSGGFREGIATGNPLRQPSVLWQMGAGVGAVDVETTSGSLALDRAE
jgi:hypothetical protein